MTFVRFFVPNFVSLLSVFFGLFAIKNSLNGLFSNAIVFIFAAVCMDYLDGFFAKKLNATSIFGAQIDSFCDAFSFGAVPAICLYFWMFCEYKTFGWILCFVIISAMILRLARFNTFDILGITNHKGVDLKKYFIGIPAPMFGILCFLPVAWFEFVDSYICSSSVYLEIDECNYSLVQLYDYQTFKAIIASYYIIISALAVSNIPVLALKNIGFVKNKLFYLLAIFAILSCILYPAISCIAISILFAVYASCSFLKIGLKK